MNVPPECERCTFDSTATKILVIICKTDGTIHYACRACMSEFINSDKTYSIFPAKDYSKPYYADVRAKYDDGPLPVAYDVEISPKGVEFKEVEVICDETTNSEEDIQKGKVRAKIKVVTPEDIKPPFSGKDSPGLLIMDETGDPAVIQEARRRLIKETPPLSAEDAAVVKGAVKSILEKRKKKKGEDPC